MKRLAALLALSVSLVSSVASAAVEPESSDYPFTLEQAAEVQFEAWVESMLGSLDEEVGQ